MIIDHKLIYPSATAYIINGFHMPQKAKLIKLSCNFSRSKSQLLSNASHLASSSLSSNGSILLRMTVDLNHFQLLGFKPMRTGNNQISLITGYYS
ncbi:hypothetical protein CKAN_00722900 [Cinnamomum micranthum f. kanehirae]|uniref:Uncharacterized protein n=1 Tax=Cinnamomum micranthum f. kanehirae TaxID=337451 RepID=A0A3S3MS86_9MAGN|nr:hypothetical protein CKAN_00722900 [Cinnamomum micranthum f. kanehirae]